MKKSITSLEDSTNTKKFIIKPDLSVYTMEELLEGLQDFVNEIILRTQFNRRK